MALLAPSCGLESQLHVSGTEYYAVDSGSVVVFPATDETGGVATGRDHVVVLASPTMRIHPRSAGHDAEDSSLFRGKLELGKDDGVLEMVFAIDGRHRTLALGEDRFDLKQGKLFLITLEERAIRIGQIAGGPDELPVSAAMRKEVRKHWR